MAVQLDDEGAIWHLDLGLVNAYLVDDGTVTLVDTGTPGAVDRLRREIADAGYESDAIDRILVTHYDYDHVGGIAELEPAVPVYAMEPDASFLDGSAQPSVLGKKGLFQRLAGLLQRVPETAIDRIEDRDDIGEFTAYHAPGHTPGHTVYHHTDLQVAMVGDLVMGDDGALDTPPWPLADNNSLNIESIDRLVDQDLSFQIACMGHGEPVTSGGDNALERLASGL